MTILIKLIAILCMLLGIIFALKPSVMKRFMSFIAVGKRIYFIGILRLLIGIFFLLFASQCRFTGIIITIGILILISGILIFTLGLEKVKDIIVWWQGRHSLVLSAISIILVFIGILVLYSV